MTRLPVLPLILLLAACGSKDKASVPADSTAEPDTQETDPPIPSAFGLDERPANPTCVAPDRPRDQAGASLERVYPNLSFRSPIWLGQAPGASDWWYVVEQRGRVLRFPDRPSVDDADVQVVLDIQGAVDAGYSESGLLGLAFHPDFAVNGQVYLSYTASGSPLISRISRFTSSDGGATLTGEQVLLTVDQPYWNHNGGHIAFGPDGFLYIGLGDGGSGGDPHNNAQNTQVLLGKMLRIDVDSGDPYAIPPDNPFADGVGGLPEIYAWGLRNPWRWTFDPHTGELWLGDVGQNAWEEIDRIELGGNYGWRIMEGYACYNPSNCSSAGLKLPYAVYENRFGASVVAGPVYYGSDIPELAGTLLYSDFGNGNLYGLFFDEVTGMPEGKVVLPNTGKALGHFATGPDQEVYILDYAGGIYRLERVGSAPVDPFPQTLSATGCVEPEDPTQPVGGMIPYDVNHPFWSDLSDKERWLAVPDGATIRVEDGDWDLPLGSVLLKHFRVGGELVETRLFVRHADGDWAGYTYLWREDGSDADLLPGGKTLHLTEQTWSVPNRGECMRCHTTAAGGSLGLETGQLNRAMVYPSTNRVSNQLATLAHIGLVEGLSDPASEPTLPAVDGSEDVEARARAYLHVNCSFCHRPGGNSRGDMDFRMSTSLGDMGICGPPQHGDLGIADARVVAPGDPARSVLSARVHTRGVDQMPPIGTNLVDEEGAALLDAWITSLGSCP